MDLINIFVKNKVLKSKALINAFKKIERKDFLPEEEKNKADLNVPLSIKFGQTNSQPETVAFMLEKLSPQKGQKILDIGSGSGWTSALLAEIVGDEGRVFGMEIIKDLKRFSEKNISKYNFIKKGIVKIFCADAYKGLPQEAPFDKILVSAVAKKIPDALLNQLAVGGRMIIPIGEELKIQKLVLISKSNQGKITSLSFPGFVFVPLIKNK